MISKIEMTLFSVAPAAFGCAAQASNASPGASAWKFFGFCSALISGSLRRLIAIILLGFVAAGCVRWVVVDVAAVSRIEVFQRTDFVGAGHTPLERFNVRFPAGLDVAANQRSAVESSVDIDIIPDQIAVDCLFPDRQIVLCRERHEALRLRLDTGSPAGVFLGVANHV